MLVRRLTLVITIIILATSTAQALSGNEWREFPKLTRHVYVLGVWNAWQDIDEATKIVTNETGVQSTSPGTQIFIKLMRCTEGMKMTYLQIAAIVEKYIEDNPSKWHSSMPSLIWLAVNNVCKEK